MKEGKKIFYLIAVFLACFYLPIENRRFITAIYEALALVKWYAQEHVLLCLLPAFFIAAAISVFIRQESVMKYFGAGANKLVSYSVAAVSGTILAVCSCTVLPIFSGIYKRGAGLGPATTFLYSGPAINILAIILTWRILGWQLGLARAVGAIIFSIIIGLLMHFIFYKEECKRKQESGFNIEGNKESRPLWQTILYFLALLGVFIFANWSNASAQSQGWWFFIFKYKWRLTILSLLLLILMLVSWFKKEELKNWGKASLEFAFQITPLLFLGVFISGFLLGRPGYDGIIPSSFIKTLVGGNSLKANFFSSFVAAFMYFATLTEVPILQGLLGAGMGKGPALALLLAGPALSLPSMLVIRTVLGTKKTVVYVMLVVVMSTILGMLFGWLVK
ncbi:MAG: permease [Candidatus Omnitrophica bacterium]|nr:permease [Candidatus Omnitrophota bacterium]